MKPKIVEYSVLSEYYVTNLEQAVAIALAEGWQPYGPLVVRTNDNGSVFVQPMVRYEERSGAERPARTPIETKNSPAAGS